MRRVRAAVAIVAALAIPGVAVAGDGASTRRLSVSPEGRPGNSRSYGCDIAQGAAAVAFDSFASNLVRRDTNGEVDIFVVDAAGLERVSVRPGGGQARASTGGPVISANGRYVAFTSLTYDMGEPGRRNRRMTVFVHDRYTGRTTRASDRSDGRRAIGHAVAYAISDSGRYVAFVSDAPDLAMKGDDNGMGDVFVHDRKTGKTNRVSLSRRLGDPNGDSSWADMSATGRYVAYASSATNIVRRDRNDSLDVFVYDRVERHTKLASITIDGKRSPDYSWDPSISADGRYVAFTSSASLAPTDAANEDVYLRDLETGTTQHVSMGYRGAANGFSQHPSISEDGRYVLFVSMADNLVPNDDNEALDVFVRDLQTQETTRVNLGEEGQEGNDHSLAAALGPDGRDVCWVTASTNLDGIEDNADMEDVYVRGPLF
ncbi:MAG TPA: hypothetical protein VG318_18725 [Actinomycetota bacterium]|nr:hypothetical protein [Actinomycetota bacterium]